MKSASATLSPARERLQAVPSPDYAGPEGIALLRDFQRDMAGALQTGDWLAVRRLDRACAGLVDRLVRENASDGALLVAALEELKGVYANLIFRCGEEVETRFQTM
ncbi:hypothetical protein [Marinimicrobium alkaliphilum]|uniref:hypothetical protein n=1 Tax=Marinimicrobium alkaliphilum TaxID=2202654 RepID=UPI000DBA1627|nr:hypothetical protein [Marinimicrobium alkaliphilum]